MTCIVAVAQDGKVWMGADSAGASGYDLTVRMDPKIFRVGGMLIGFTSSFRMGQLLGYRLALPRHHPDQSVDDYLHREFIDSVRDTLKAGGFVSNSSGREDSGTFLVGYAGRVFTVYDDFQIAESAHPFAACGSGAAVALGSMHSTSELPPNVRLEKALRAAEAFNAGVRAPFRFEALEA